MTHPTWEEINLHFFEGLEPGRREEVASHVAGCPECATLLAHLEGEARAVSGAIAGGAAPAPPARLASRTARQVRRARVARIAAAALLAAGVIVVAGIALLPGDGGRRSGDGRGPSPESQAQLPETAAPFLARVISGDGLTDVSGRPVAAGTILAPGESVSLAARARAEVLLGDGTYLEALPGTEVAIGPLQSGRPRIRLSRGRVFLDVAKGSATLTVETGAGEVRALGTRFEVSAPAGGEGRIEVTVWEGRVELSAAGGRILGRRGEILWSERGGASGKRIGLPGERAWLFPSEIRVPEVSAGPLGPWRIEFAGERVLLVAQSYGLTERRFVRANRTVVLSSDDQGRSFGMIADLPGKAPLDSRTRDRTLSLLAMDFESGALETIDISLDAQPSVKRVPLPPLSQEATWARWAWIGERGVVLAGGPGKLLARELATSPDGGATWEAFSPFEAPAPRDPEDEEVDWALGSQEGRYELWRLGKAGDSFSGYSSAEGRTWRAESVAVPPEHRPARLRQILELTQGPHFLATGLRGHFLVAARGEGQPEARPVPGDAGAMLVSVAAGENVLALEGRSSSHHRAHLSTDAGRSWQTGLLSEHVSGRVGSALAGAVSPEGDAVACFHRARMVDDLFYVSPKGRNVRPPRIAVRPGVSFEPTHLLFRRYGHPAEGGEERPDAPANADRIRSLVADLGAASWQTREAAERELVRIGPAARTGVEEAARSDDPEVRERASRVLPLLGEPWWTEEEG
ncbi:MAG: FecR domain-containing protein [Planctomycetes bacterium]|nr:FecR domain-containing protein [Planctomycetota bacterium]